MPGAESQPQPTAGEALQLAELAEMALSVGGLGEFVEGALPAIGRLMQSSSAFLYVADPRLPAPQLLKRGFHSQPAPEIEDLCAEQFRSISSQPAQGPVRLPPRPGWQMAASLVLYPLQAQEACVGLLGLAAVQDSAPSSPAVAERLISLLANTVSRFLEQTASERQLAHLNTYLTISSMLAQELGLHELLEIALYCCMEAASAEAASVLLLDDDKRNFAFYQVEGPAKPVLMAATFPASRGLASAILDRQQSEIINDVQSDPRFYERIDSETGFQTRNMIAVPLVAGEEKIGVLEVLNKADGGPFTGEEHLLLVSAAEEIAFAIRNARVFDYVVNTYCKQRQGLTSCRGCERPLGSWTPCVKYREVSA
jgi:GAF domain-containing protein